MRYSERFRVEPGSRVGLASIDPSSKEKNETKESAQIETAAYAARLRELQYLVYAEDRRSVLVCLQGLDAGGKDGTIRHVLGAMNPQGTRVHAFKVPSREEAAHDFLWRAHVQAPRRGEIVVFNRSHYEDVLVVRVHGLVPKDVWSKRYELINEFERNLVAGGTHVIKFFLHISPEEQLDRFRQRLEDPARQWKISESDYTERALWPAYIAAYEEALARTSTKEAPWYVIPANHKWVRNLAVSRIMVETLESLGMRLPKPSVNLDEIRAKYHAAKHGGTEGPAAGGEAHKR
jgi:PPK2 family polyphosphate:nucleotide phosphotransferase